MARLAAVSKALFYPTQPTIVERIAGLNIVPEALRTEAGDRPLTLLDPCAGEGAAAGIAKAWGLVPYGIELDAGRAEKANAAFSALGGKCLHGSIFQLDVAGQCDVLFGNWPYDDITRGSLAEDEAEDASWDRRLEVRFLRHARRWLRQGGVLVQIIPEHVAVSNAFLDLMATFSYRCRALRYPELEYQQFKQVVVFSVMSGHTCRSYPDKLIEVWRDGPNALDVGRRWDVPEIELVRNYAPVAKAVAFSIRARGLDPELLEPALDSGAYAKLLDLATPTSAKTERPLRPLRDGHLAMLLAAGCLDGTEVEEADGARVLVKGSSTKTTVVREDEEAKKSYETERFSSRLATLNLVDGELKSLSLDDDPDAVAAWLERHGPALAEAVRRRFPPRVTDLDVELTSVPVVAPGILPGETVPRLLFPQRAAAVATARWWERAKTAAISGEMTVGKTLVSIAAAVMHGGKFIVFCPSHLVDKWIREIVKVSGLRATSAKKLAEVDEFFTDPDLRFLVLGKEVAKLGARWRPAYAIRTQSEEVDRVRIELVQVKRWYDSNPVEEEKRTPYRELVRVRVLCCPKCGKQLVTKDAKMTESELAKDKLSCLANVENGRGVMVPCGERLWQATPISDKGTKRWPLASYIALKYTRRYSLIVDESHTTKGADSDVAQAAHKLRSASVKSLDMTGTWYGGRASSIFYLLYRISPDFRAVYKYNEVARFVDAYGLYETSYATETRGSGKYGYRRSTQGRIREIPGAHPGMIRLLLPFTSFIRVADLGYALPAFTEHVVTFAPDDEIRTASEALIDCLRPLMRTKPRILGAYLMAGLGWPDRPDREESIIDPDPDDAACAVLATLPALPDASLPKDDWLISLCQDEKLAGRKVMVYFTQTDKRDPGPRIKLKLEAVGVRCAILRGSVATDKREAWLRTNEPSFDVLLVQAELVEMGLDIMWATTIVFYQVNFRVSTVRQASRRSWRLGQTLPVNVYHLAYDNTLQAPALGLVAKKVRAAELLDGADHGGLVTEGDTGGGDFFMELARAAVANRAYAQ